MSRIIDYTEATSPVSDDYLVIDGSTNGTRKIKPENIVVTDPTFTKSGKAADAKVVGDKIGELKSAIDNTTGNVKCSIVADGYIATNGSTTDYTVVPSAGYSYAIIDCSANDIFTITGSGQSTPRLWAFVNSSNEIINKAPSSESLTNGVLIAPYGAVKLVVNLANHTGYVFKKLLLKKRVMGLENSINKQLTLTQDDVVSGSFINGSGQFKSGAHFMRTGFVPIDSSRLIIESTLSGSAGLVFFKADKSTITYSITGDTASSRGYKDGTLLREFDVPAETAYFVASYLDPTDIFNALSFYITFVYNILKVKNELESQINSIELDNINYIDYFSMFDSVVCCGDSLTYGAVFTASNTHRQAKAPYPNVLAKLTGMNVSALATSGYAPTNWWNAYNDQITGSNKLYIIYLGTNNGLTDTLSTDCVGDNYADYANTETGCYGKIVQKITDTGSKAILVKVYAAEGTGEVTTNSVIEQIGARWKFPVVDNEKLMDEYYHYYPDKSGSNSAHYNDIGYVVFASQLYKNISLLSPEDAFNLI